MYVHTFAMGIEENHMLCENMWVVAAEKGREATTMTIR